MRVRSEFSNHPNGMYQDYFPNNTPPPVSIVMGRDYEKTTSDTVVPGFRARSAAGGIFNNPFSSHAIWTSFSGNYHSEQWSNSGTVWAQTREYDHGIWSGINSFSHPFTYPDLLGSAGNKALAGVNSTGFNAPLFVAEWAKTRALIPQIGALLVKTFRDGRKIVRGRPGGSLVRMLPPTSRNLANAWLIGRFGVTPLLYELQGLCELLTKTQPPRATARGNDSWEAESITMYDFGDAPGTWHIRKKCNVQIDFRAGILYEAGASNASNLAQLGVTRPATVLWELVPWSFVIDRFVDISSWLDAVQPDMATKTLAAWRGSKTVLTVRNEVSGFTPGPNFGVSSKNSAFTGVAIQTVIGKVRSPWTPTASLPVWNPYFNFKHLGDYAALVRQRIRSGA